MEIVISNPDRAEQVLREIDEVLAWKKDLESTVEKKMMALANNLLEAYQNRYWTHRGFQDESQYIEAIFPRSRSLYYDLIRIAKNLNHYDHELLEDIGVFNCRELCKVQKRFGMVPETLLLDAKCDDQETFKAKVKSAVGGDCDAKRDPREEVLFVTLSFVGDQIYDFNEAVRIAQMEAGTDKQTEAVCVLARDFLSGYRDDGKGRVQGRNAFLVSLIGRLHEQIDVSQEGIYDKLITQLATWVEKGRDRAGTPVEGEEDQALEG